MRHVALRPVTAADAAMIRGWRNLPAVREQSLTQHDIAEDEHGAWFAAMLASARHHYWVICVDQRAAGVVFCVEQAREARHADAEDAGRYGTWGIYLGEAWAYGTGVATAGAALSLDWAFDVLELPEIRCVVLVDNHRARSLYRLLGFAEENPVGRLAEQAPGVARGPLTLSLGPDTWRELRLAVMDTCASRGVILNATGTSHLEGREHA